MEKELIINVKQSETRIALLEDKQLVELHHEKGAAGFKVGDIYLGRIKKLNPGLNAAFIDVGHERDAFLHYTDLSPQNLSLQKYMRQCIKGTRKDLLQNFQIEPEIIKTGKINTVLTKGRPLMVQVLKEPISTKGPRLTCEITLAGRYLVLTPFSNTIGVSKKIAESDERKRLERLIASIKPENFGVIVRTVAEGKTVSELHKDLEGLLEKWRKITNGLHKAQAPQLILSETSKANTLIRDFLSDSFTHIAVNDKVLTQQIKDFVKQVAPGTEKIVNHYNSKRPMFDAYGINKQIKSLFGKTVSVESGAYLVIEHTEALHVIDVNSGQKVSKKSTQEENAVAVNTELAKEIARQLRLRDLGGIIIVDFIDMRNPEHKKAVYKAMKDAMSTDNARHSVVPISKIGLMQITRERTRPEVNISTSEVCPTCAGTGKVEAPILIVDDIQKTVKYILMEQNQGGIKLYVHPFIESFLKKGKWFSSMQWKWFREYHKWVKVYSNNSYHLTEYHFFDKNGEEMIMED